MTKKAVIKAFQMFQPCLLHKIEVQVKQNGLYTFPEMKLNMMQYTIGKVVLSEPNLPAASMLIFIRQVSWSQRSEFLRKRLQWPGKIKQKDKTVNTKVISRLTRQPGRSFC